jgi:hypothetical protein
MTADLPLAGQLAPGDWIEFAACTRADALAALRDRETALGAGPGSDHDHKRVRHRSDRGRTRV